MAELSVSKKNIYSYLTDSFQESKVKLFIIPEYQRPYSWDVEKCDILWNDIKDFHQKIENRQQGEYFLGTIVTCIEGASGVHIIDGQQRITSFFLMLRAFYTKLEAMLNESPSDDEIQGLMNQIGSCIWDVNPMSKKVTDKTQIHIKSLVATEKDNDIFHSIIRTGEIIQGKSNYSQNYNYFFNQCDEYARKYPMDWKELCLSVLNQCIVLPIECKDLDAALTIFSTLNDRGLPLSDSDIFKAELYRLQSDGQKEAFTQQWKDLSEVVDDSRMSINDIFRYYTHNIRAVSEDKSKEIGLRKFYSDNKYEKLKDPTIMDNLYKLSVFWSNINKYDDSVCTEETKKYIHCLQCYPNEYWKYPTTVFFFKHNSDYKEKLSDFLKNLLSFLFVKFIENPTVNAIKDPIFQACIDVYKTGRANLSYALVDFENKMNALSSSKISKPILLLNSYLYDENQSLLPADFHIEHIFPQKWDNTYFTWSKEEADKYINMFGNKIAFESKLNIQASNGFYSKKKQLYAKSKIIEVKSLDNYNDWTADDIQVRTNAVIQRLKVFFEQHLSSTETKIDCLLEYEGGSSNVILNKHTTAGTVTYCLNVDGIEESFYSLEETISKIDRGMIRFGTKKFSTIEIDTLIAAML